jgi:hypothetical protein
VRCKPLFNHIILMQHLVVRNLEEEMEAPLLNALLQGTYWSRHRTKTKCFDTTDSWRYMFYQVIQHRVEAVVYSLATGLPLYVSLTHDLEMHHEDYSKEAALLHIGPGTQDMLQFSEGSCLTKIAQPSRRGPQDRQRATRVTS